MLEAAAIVLLLLLLIFPLMYWYWTANFDYWKKRGLPHPSYSLLFGNVSDMLFMKRALGDIIQEIYDSFEDLNYVGVYKVRRPAILIRDAKLAKAILIKDFSSFHDNDIRLNEKVDPLAQNIFALKGERWKALKQELKPFFTPKKQKVAIPVLNESGKTMVEYIDNLIKNNKQEDVKSIVMRFAVQSVATAGFSITADESVINIFSSGFNSVLGGPKEAVANMMPNVAYYLRFSITPVELSSYFDRVYKDLLKERISKGIVREDYMNYLLELYKKSLLTEKDVVSQAITLFFGGTESTSESMSTALYELASNPEKQEKLKEEVEERLTGELTYESLQEMKYLDCVVNEALRLHPPAPVLNKVCTQAFKLPPVNKDGTGKEIVVEPGTPVFIPIRAIHLDPNNYPDVKKFYPERFLDGSKGHAWLAFGNGPRICLGRRFALLQIKVCLVYLVKHFKIKLNSKTIVPLQYNPSALSESIKGGIWLDFERREKM